MAPYKKTIPSDGIFPQFAVLVNHWADTEFPLRFIQRDDREYEDRDVHMTTDAQVNQAHLFKGVEIKFLDGKPAGGEKVTVLIDGEKIVDRWPACEFTGLDPKFIVDLGQKKRLSAFWAAPRKGSKEMIGYFLPPSMINVHVDTDRSVKIRLALGKYQS